MTIPGFTFLFQIKCTATSKYRTPLHIADDLQRQVCTYSKVSNVFLSVTLLYRISSTTHDSQQSTRYYPASRALTTINTAFTITNQSRAKHRLNSPSTSHHPSLANYTPSTMDLCNTLSLLCCWCSTHRTPEEKEYDHNDRIQKASQIKPLTENDGQPAPVVSPQSKPTDLTQTGEEVRGGSRDAC